MAQPCALNSPKYIPSKSLCLVMFTFYYHLAKKTPSYLEGRDTELINHSTKELYLPHRHILKSVRKWMLLLNKCYKILSGHFFAICIFIFHKTEVQTVILRCLMGLYLNWLKSYGLKCRKMQIFPFPFLCDFVQKHKFAFFAFLGFVS